MEHPNSNVNQKKKNLSNFELMLEIGRGGYGTVYLSKDKET